MHTTEQAIEAIKNGQFVIVVDDESRENEGDLIIAAEKITPQAIAFMVRYTTGIICLSMTKERLNELHIPPMVAENTELHRTKFTVSVDSSQGITTGVSASDRAKTIKALIDKNEKPESFRRPGHIFPLCYQPGGVLKRAGHTEAALDLATLAGLYPAGVLCELVNDDGSMSRLPDLEKFAAEHKLCLVSVADIIRFRRKTERLVKRISESRLPTEYGEFKAYVYESIMDGVEHLVLTKGTIDKNKPLLVRVHSECLTGDVFHSCRCDCRAQLARSMELINAEGSGAIVYLRGHEGRGIGLGHKVRAYHLQDEGKDTVEANLALGFPVDSRDYGIGSQILADLGAGKLRLLTNNPAKYNGISGFDIDIVERVPLVCEATNENRRYLETKKNKMGHLF